MSPIGMAERHSILNRTRKNNYNKLPACSAAQSPHARLRRWPAQQGKSAMLEMENLSEVTDIGKSVATGDSLPAVVTLPQPTLGSAAQMEKLIGVALLVGVLLSAIIVSFGGVVYVWRHSGSTVHYRVFRGEPSDLRNLEGIAADVETFSGRGIIQIGLMLLVGLQLMRVVLTGALFLISRDKLYIVISTIVLGLLLYGIFWESAGGH